MTLAIRIVDAFTSAAFKGNPAGVCILETFPADSVMQNIAMEMNLAETAFLVSKTPLHYSLRWFTPAVEVNLCGHATLAATHVLLQTGAIAAGDKVCFDTLSDVLVASVDKDGVITLDFPLLAGKPANHPALSALGVNILACEKNRDNYLVEVEDYKTLMACSPDFKALAALDQQGVIVTASKGSPSGYDFASRYFAPSAGIDEDPVTGSAHCFLAPYWAAKLNKATFRALQASKRTGILDVAISGDRVLLSGRAVTTLEGALQITPPAKENAA